MVKKGNIAMSEAVSLILVIAFLVVVLPIIIFVKKGASDSNAPLVCAQWVTLYKNSPRTETGSFEYSFGRKIFGEKCKTSRVSLDEVEKENVLKKLTNYISYSWFITGKGSYNDIFPTDYGECFTVYILKYESDEQVTGSELIDYLKTTIITEKIGNVELTRSVADLLLSGAYPFYIAFLDSSGDAIRPENFKFKKGNNYIFMLRSYENQEYNVLYIKEGLNPEYQIQNVDNFKENLKKLGLDDQSAQQVAEPDSKKRRCGINT